MKRILIAGLGNIFQGDDAFGVEVVRGLQRRPPRQALRLVDYGIRAYDLAYALTEDYDAIVLVDAATLGQKPGTLYLIEPDLKQVSALDQQTVDAHALNLISILQMAQSFGHISAQLFVVGCEPAVLEIEDGRLGLSRVVQAAVPDAIEMIDALASQLLGEPQNANPDLVPA
jgi:hydrogenase maturation protease